MKQILFLIILTLLLLQSSPLQLLNASTNTSITFIDDPPHNEVKVSAFKVLDTKCNVCHRRQNPFKVFSLKNMNKHAAKIHQQVFVLRRMPKGGAIKLTEEEYSLLKEWLESQNIN
ncbi:MAG: hypothetical protein AAGI49_16160 [Bacteroidota bacterium]